jgi:hypothetical protein
MMNPYAPPQSGIVQNPSAHDSEMRFWLTNLILAICLIPAWFSAIMVITIQSGVIDQMINRLFFAIWVLYFVVSLMSVVDMAKESATRRKSH